MTEPATAERVPPQSIEAEQSVLGGLLLDNSAWDRAGDLLTAADFYRVEHRLIYAALAETLRAGQPADVITVCDLLQCRGQADECGGMVYLNQLAQSVPSAANVRRYAEIVQDRAALRRLIDAGDEISSFAFKAPTAADALRRAQDVVGAVAAPPGRALVRTLDHVRADELPDDDGAFDDELIEGTIGRGAMAVLYGDSNSGKTFAAIDMAAAVARGVDWLGRHTAGGLVVYLATESPGSVQMRLRAYQRHHALRVPGFVIVRSPINLFDGMADTTAVLALIEELEREHGEKVSLIIGDTLARLAAGANENSGEDMSIVVRNADAIRMATGAAFLLIHHTGKDAAKGMRGWSGMRAATDTEIEVTVDEATGLHSAEITKQRDLPGKGDRIGFRLVPVLLGVNRWGAERGSCVVESADAPAKIARGKRPSEIAGAIVEVLTTHGAGLLKGRLAKHFDPRYASSSVYREIGKMVADGRLIEAGGMVAMPGRPVLSGSTNQVPTSTEYQSVSGFTEVPIPAAPYRGAVVGTSTPGCTPGRQA